MNRPAATLGLGAACLLSLLIAGRSPAGLLLSAGFGISGAAVAARTKPGEFCRFGKNRQRQVRAIALRTLPKPIGDRLQWAAADPDLLRQFNAAPHRWIVGKTGAGKTTIAKAAIVASLEAQPDLQLTICDINYGKPGDGGRVNTWMDAPVQCIRKNLDEAIATVDAHHAELERRKQLCQQAAIAHTATPKLEPWLIVLDEWDSLQEDANAQTKGEFGRQVRSLLKQGRGYRMQVVLIGQVLAVGESGISEATRGQLSALMLGKTCTDASQVKRFESDTARLVGFCEAIAKAGRRPGIIQLGDAPPSAFVVPDLGWVGDVRLVAPEQTDPDAEWWAASLTDERDAAARAIASDGQPNARKRVAALFGLSKISNANRRYAEFLKPYFEELTSENS